MLSKTLNDTLLTSILSRKKDIVNQQPLSDVGKMALRYPC